MMFLNICLLLLAVPSCMSIDECPTKCFCKRGTQKDGYLKVSCGEEEKISTLEEIDLLNVADELGQLNLSGNYLKTFSLLAELPILQKLDLSKNQISDLLPYQFKLTPALRRLDISSNNIKHIDLLAFEGLQHLERLKLNQNQIATIVYGTFDPLVNFKQVDISQNPLICDCGLLWLLDWSQKKSVKLLSNPKCNSPAAFRGQLLRKLKIGDDILCKSPAENGDLPIVDLRPDNDQVVFEGDTLTLQCHAPTILDTYEEDSVTASASKLEWSWSGGNPTGHFPELSIEGRALPSAGRVWSTLTIPKLNRQHAGIWSCFLLSVHGNFSKEIALVVISDESRYCPMTMTVTNKGSYSWPRTLVNNSAKMPCQSLNLNYDAERQRAYHTCDAGGRWANLNTSACSYISEHTKILEQFSKVNSSIEESAKHFRNYTLNKNVFEDPVDLAFAVDTILGYLGHSPPSDSGTVAAILMDVADGLLDLPEAYLRHAQQLYNTSLRLLEAMETMAVITTASSPFHQTNLALESFTVKKEAFEELRCTWYLNTSNPKSSMFSCSSVGNSQSDIISLPGKTAEASITVPGDLFEQLRDQSEMTLVDRRDFRLLVAMHRTAKLFKGKDADKKDVTSAVVGVNLGDIKVTNLTTPVYAMVRRPPSTDLMEVRPFAPVRWDPSANDGTGEWTSEGCSFSHQLQDHLVFSCDQFGFYGLLQDVSRLRKQLESEKLTAKFKFSHPAIYVGAFILFISFLVAIMTYLLCYFDIQMPKKAKHSLVNTWMSIVLLCYVYIFGIHQTEDVRLCQGVGMTLHYLTLCSLLWMCVALNCMYKRLSKHRHLHDQAICNLQDDDLPSSSDRPVQKPILGLYLVGWGIGLIVCGLSAAINVNEYATLGEEDDGGQCFLRPGPALSALYAPVAILLLFLMVMFLLVRCAAKDLDGNGHLSEGTQATEHVDLELLEPNFPSSTAGGTTGGGNNATGNVEARSVSSKTASSSEMEDPEHAPTAQLNAHAIFLTFYVLTWLCAAFATASPFRMVAFEEQLFSIAFAVLATMLSAFTLFFYCVARSDVRTRWMIFLRWLTPSGNNRKQQRPPFCLFRSRNVSDRGAGLPPHIQIQPLPPLPPGEQQVVGTLVSRSTSRSSTHTKSNGSHVLKGAVDLNGGNFSDSQHHQQPHQGAKINNVNLVVLHRQQYRTNVIPNIIENPTNAAQVFYNPHQSTVARKFFKRQKRNMLKKNNLTKPPLPQPRDLNSDSASVFSDHQHHHHHRPKVKNAADQPQNIFGTNSKVNNTNIHVEQVRRVQQKNPNIFSDSAEDLDSVSNVPVDNIVINAERLRKREMSKQQQQQKSPAVQPPTRKKQQNHGNGTMKSASDKNMRSVSQQCTLDYSSETISDSILDKPCSPDKSMDVHHPMLDGGSSLVVLENDPHYCRINDARGAGVLPADATCVYAHPYDEEAKRGEGSSVSVSDLDELYQQIRSGGATGQRHNRYRGARHAAVSPYLSDSEVNSFVSDRRHRRNRTASYSHLHFDRYSDDVETTV
ncbi:unnamed protein product [Acanthoscelides obtectus]|uniref:Adhesion G protein-coupled receptor A3 n=1 Tax=Acanthoscelides obtectus TaxID=200917 RepID=A0A9P0JVP0_ACAOB|nr:unnamed protein product [Acanthoscelides obtectus]CAK1667316.1 Adhesion G protein-coupled receptor A3 [Acanthoscelides obtectus]